MLVVLGVREPVRFTVVLALELSKTTLSNWKNLSGVAPLSQLVVVPRTSQALAAPSPCQTRLADEPLTTRLSWLAAVATASVWRVAVPPPSVTAKSEAFSVLGPV